jgi:hypothetical protein
MNFTVWILTTTSQSPLMLTHNPQLTPPTPTKRPRGHDTSIEALTLYGSSQITLFKISGTTNCANSLTKPLTMEQLASEAAIYEVEVEP